MAGSAPGLEKVGKEEEEEKIPDSPLYKTAVMAWAEGVDTVLIVLKDTRGTRMERAGCDLPEVVGSRHLMEAETDEWMLEDEVS